MKSHRPDLLVIISFIFVIGAVATSLTTSQLEPKAHLQLSQHILR